MALMPIADIKPGMQLAQDVTSQGRTLLAEGSIISEKHIRIMLQWGITEVDIQGEQGSGSLGTQVEQLDEATRAAHEPILQKLFRLNDLQHPMIKELYNATLLRKCAR